MAKKAKKSQKKQVKQTVSKKTTQPAKPQQQTKQASDKSTAVVPVHQAIPSMPTCVFGRNQRKPDELIVMDVHTRLAMAAMPIPVDPTPRTKIAVNIGNQLIQLYEELYKAQLPQGAIETFQAHIACAYEAVGLACLF